MNWNIFKNVFTNFVTSYLFSQLEYNNFLYNLPLESYSALPLFLFKNSFFFLDCW